LAHTATEIIDNHSLKETALFSFTGDPNGQATCGDFRRMI
jgi:hypothetical protein